MLLQRSSRAVHFAIARRSRSLAMIKIKNFAQSRTSFDRSDSVVVVLGEEVRHHKFVAETLMVPLALVVLHKLIKQMPQMCLPATTLC